MSLTVGTDAHDGDLRQCLSKCHEFIIKHCICKLGMTTLSDFVDFATKADYAEEIKKIRDGVMMKDNITPALIKDGVALATLRTAWVAGRKARHSTPTTELESTADVEAPLGEVKFTELRTSWKLTHPNISFDESMTAADGITARNFREFRRITHTLLPMNRVRTLAQDKRPLDSVETDYGLVIKQTSSQLQKKVHIESVIDYYWPARALTQTWAFVGNYKVKSSKQSMDDTLYCPLGISLLYADHLLRKTANPRSDGNSNGLAWMQDRDELTRGRILMLAREGVPMGEAIEAATQDTKVEWAMNNATTRATEVNSKKRDATVIKNTGQPTRPEKRQEGQSKGGKEQPRKVETATFLQGGEPICKKRNDDRGCTKREQDCPDKRAHRCDAIVNGKACGKENCFRRKH
jgi:hypothetical protein